MLSNTVERFLRYVKIDTMSEEGHDTTPSTAKQFDLARLLKRELEEMGASGVYLDEEKCYVYACVPSNLDRKAPKLGFVAHMDTSPAVSDTDVKPVITGNYDGSPIEMGTEGRVLSPKEYPALLDYVGKTVICSDGSTLLGADDKSGVAEIMGMAEYLLTHPEFPHGDVKICFTPDEEVGMGVSGFDYERFGADFAYTMDGGPVGDLNYECFNAAAATVTVNGLSIHPGSAKDRMKNAVRLAMEFDSLLPAAERPEHTEGYEGFFHLDSISGDVDRTVMNYIIRDHDPVKFDARKDLFRRTAEFLNARYGEGTFAAEIRDSYRNMREIIEENIHLIDNAKKAYAACGEQALISPIRGGTDGATLSYHGLPCPNLGTGGHNFHGRYEFITAEGIDRMVEVGLELIRIYAQA